MVGDVTSLAEFLISAKWSFAVNKMIKTMIVAVALVSAPLSFADGGKVAVLDVQEAILNTNMAKSEMKSFEARSDISKMINDAEKLKKDISSLRSSIENGGSDAQDKQKTVEFKQADFELIVRKLNAERQVAGKRLMDNIGPRLESAVKSIVDTDGIGLLLDRKAVIHANSSFDITAKVTEKLNTASSKK
jgi:outer membrane protein